MYCKNCHTLIPDGEVICPECEFDNSQKSDILEETKEIHLNPNCEKVKEKKVRVKKIFILIASLLIIGLVVLYMINDSKSLEESKSRVKENININLDSEFTLEMLKIKYPASSFGASKSTIFYKNNNAYNIEINLISEDTYNTLANNNARDSKIGEIITKTYSEDRKEHHIFSYNNVHYLITINYDSEDSNESSNIKNILSKIINSSYFSK